MGYKYELVAIAGGCYDVFRVRLAAFEGDSSARLQICWAVTGIDNALGYCVSDNGGRPVVMNLTSVVSM